MRSSSAKRRSAGSAAHAHVRRKANDAKAASSGASADAGKSAGPAAKPRRTARLRAQLALLIADGTRVRDPRGGKRPGAGRPSRKERPSERHKRRPEVNARHPQHVVIRVVPTVGNLRRKHAYRALRRASIVIAARRDNFRICHISVQRTHVHLLVEADDRIALARGMQGFQIAAARRLNAAVDVVAARRARRGARAKTSATNSISAADSKRTGSRPVFADRYHATPITGPRQAHAAIAYVLNNWRRHGEHTLPEARTWRVDPYSTAPQFTGWAGTNGESLPVPPAALAELGIDGALQVAKPVTWLLLRGWQTHGDFRPSHRPGPGPSRSR